MKSYLLILLLLIAIGFALAVRVATQNQSLDETVFLQTTESIRNLQSADEKLSVLLHQSRLNKNFKHISLRDTHYEISEEFDTLRFEALFEEIESSPQLAESVGKFEQAFLTREDLLDQYIAKNEALAQNLLVFKDSLMVQNVGDSAEVETKYLQISNFLYQSVLEFSEDASSRLALMSMIETVEATQSSQMPNLVGFKQAAKAVLTSDTNSRQIFRKLQNLQTGRLLDQVGNSYTNFHNGAIENAKRLRDALIIYGLALLGALLFFGYLIRKNFMSLERQVEQRTAQIANAYSELQESQEQLIQSEKMASLGGMVAGVAHEINTPLGYVSSNVDTINQNMTDVRAVIHRFDAIYREAISKNKDRSRLTKKLVTALKFYQKSEITETMEESEQLLADGAYGLGQISDLVIGLKDFSRLDRQSSEQVDVHDCIESSLTIGSNHLKENGISVVKNFAKLPKLECIPSKLNQVFLNIITNASQSMKDQAGTLKITTTVKEGKIIVEFKDEGSGIDPAALQNIFDPFYTTKEVGEGTGLGLSIAYKIVSQHGGEISAQSKLGIGTSITVSLPVLTNIETVC